jgi:UDPglucose 6-dehydrogenase
MRVCMIGTGYVGLVTGTCFAELGHEVMCIDKDQSKIDTLMAGEIPIYEPGLSELVKANITQERLLFSTDINDAAKFDATLYFIAVGTPSKESDGSADLKYVYGAAEDAARAIQKAGISNFAVFVTKSTVPVGTSRDVAKIIGKFLPDNHFAVASNPEFMREGSAIEDFMKPDRVVVGSRSEKARALLEELYRPLTRQGRPLVMTSTVETAEIIKYAANTFLATKISFINELARLCEKIGADVEELALGMGLDSRIGDKFLKPGPGYGGSCFPKDTAALIKTARDFGSPVEIVEATKRTNDLHKSAMVEKISAAMGGKVNGKNVAVLGLAFKAKTDDMRDSPSLTIVPELLKLGAKITAFDPIAAENAKKILGDKLIYSSDLAATVNGADAVVIVTEWDEFRRANWKSLSKTMAKPVMIDLRNLFDLQDASDMGLDYTSLGRDTSSANATSSEK